MDTEMAFIMCNQGQVCHQPLLHTVLILRCCQKLTLVLICAVHDLHTLESMCMIQGHFMQDDDILL